jgi:ketosteroid isomerase-like protein
VTEDDSAALAARYWQDLWGQQDLALVDELMADPYTRHSAIGTTVLRRTDLKKDLTQAWRLLHGAVTTVDDQAVSGDRVWTRATTRGVNVETGEASVLTWLIVHRVEGGRLAESWSATLPGVDWT